METASASSWNNVDLAEPYRVQIRTQLAANGLPRGIGLARMGRGTSLRLYGCTP